MLEGGRISNKQLQWILVSTVLPTAVLFLPSVMITQARQDSWLSVILVGVWGLFAGYIITKLGTRFPNQTLISYSTLIAGDFLGRIINLIYILFFLHIDATILREFGEVIISVFLQQTPMLLIIILIVVISASAIRNGIEVISRVNEIFFPSIIGFLFVVYLFMIPDLDLSNLKPVLENGLMPVVKGAYPAALFLAETIILIIVLPTVNRPSKVFNSVFKALTVLGVLGLIAIIEILAVFGPVEGGQLKFPLLSLIRYISLFDFINRIDSLMMAIWISGGFIKVTVFYYCLTISTAEFFNLNSYKPIVLPLGVILTASSLILYGNIHDLAKVLSQVLPPYYLFIEVGIPLLLLVIAMVRGIKEDTG